jgi:adenine-specific DNA-methyltransferase
MANINETIANVEKLDPELARQLRKYVKDHSYGLVFEHNLPEAVRLYTKTAAVGDTVNIRPERGKDETDENKVAWNVKAVKDGMAAIENGTEEREVAVEDLVPIVSYRDVIYPGLREVDRIERGDKDDPYQVVINAENYHALEMLAYCYAGKVDCIYIDPPYNTGAKDWKYNNDYVDGNDQYRHSKWLAFMERRLKLAKRLLNPADSVLIVTIDEKEYARLGLLLEQMFPEARVQMVSTCISSHGNQRTNQFSRSDEYIYFVEFGTASVQKVSLSDDWRVNPKDNRIAHARWIPFLRSGNRKTRNDSPNCFYPIYISKKGKKFLGVGDVLPKGEHPDLTKEYSDKIEIWPVREDGSEGCWCATSETLLELQANHFFRIGRRTKYGSSFSYLYSAERKKVEKGLYKVSGIAEDGSYLFDDSGFVPKFIPMTQWSIKSHDASIFGTQLLHDIFKDKRFPFPKSVYAVRDALRFFVSNKPDALIIDFFAGSGTTLQGVCQEFCVNRFNKQHRIAA